ncbi:MAG TPA: MarR family transcriptional regulator [Burkholderiaceae bacterium]|nr:MarR family transcriptional regulator [Burkholderiaceae bacterium]
MSTETEARVAVAGETLSLPVQAFRLTIALALHLRTLMDRQMAATGVTTQQAALLTVVDMLGRPALTEAARALAMSHQNVKQLASALERKGLLEILPDASDRRSKRLATTRRHKALWARRDPDDHAAVAAWFAGMKEAEIAQLVALLAKAMNSVRAARDA